MERSGTSVRTTLLLAVGIALLGGGGSGARAQQGDGSPPAVPRDRELAAELRRMYEADQKAAAPRTVKTRAELVEWRQFRDSVFEAHARRAREIFEEHGYPGYDRVGEEGARAFWAAVQHADHTPEFQARVLEAMKREVAGGNASPARMALLTDRVRLARDRPQLYGTQVDYDAETCRAVPRAIADSAGLAERRAEVGLPPLEAYLNRMTRNYYRLRKEACEEKGITEPPLHEVGPEAEEPPGGSSPT